MKLTLPGLVLILIAAVALTSCGKKASNSDQQKIENAYLPSRDQVATSTLIAFRESIESKSVLKVKNFLLNNPGIDLNRYLDNGDTPLIIAIKNNATEVRNFLIDKGANLEKSNMSKETPLIIAVLNEDLNSVRVLLDKKISLEDKDSEERTALQHAILLEQEDIALWLLKKGAKVNLEYFELAKSKKLFNVRDLIQLIIQVQIGTPEPESLRKVILLGDQENLEKMLTTFPKIAIDYTHLNPLVLIFEVSDKNFRQVAAQLLIEKNANINGPKNAETTPLIKAVQSQSLVLAQLFLKAGADPQLVDEQGKSALIHAIELNNLTLVRLLINYEAYDKYKIHRDNKKYSYKACSVARRIERKLKTDAEKDSMNEIKDLLDCFSWSLF